MDDRLPAPLSERYRLAARIRENEFGTVWRAETIQSGQKVILKWAKGESEGRLLMNESRMLLHLKKHPDASSPVMGDQAPAPSATAYGRNADLACLFPSQLEYFTWQGEDGVKQTVLVRTWVEGMTLEELCETGYCRQGIPTEKSLDYLIRLCEIIRCLHSLDPPVIHRDLKPQNIVIDPAGECHVIDFGISRLLQKNNTVDTDTQIMGTRVIAPPEQFGYRQTDERSDIYSLGIVLCYCLTGEYDITHARAEIQDEEILRIIQKAAKFDPDQRYQTVDAMLSDLLACRFGEILLPEKGEGEGKSAGGLKRRTGSSKRLHSPKMLWRRILPAGTGLLLVLLTVITRSNIPWLRQGSRSRPASEAPDMLSSHSAALPSEASSASVYTFKEPLLESAVREILNRPTGDLTEEDLSQITSMHLYGMQTYTSDLHILFFGIEPYAYVWEQEGTALYRQRGTISSLEDLWHLPNLTELDLHYQQIENISVLAQGACPRLSRLGLGKNPIRDYSPLSSLQNLTGLNLAFSDIADLSFLQSLYNLEALNLAGTKVTSLSQVPRDNLRELNLADLAMTSPEELKSFTALDTLFVNRLGSDILSVLPELPLKDLTICNSAGRSLADLPSMDALETLSFGEIWERDSQRTLADFPSLRVLDLAGVCVSDFTFLNTLKSLEHLQIHNVRADTYEGLDGLPSLIRIDCSKEQALAIRARYPQLQVLLVY